jgi:hypothetical protein
MDLEIVFVPDHKSLEKVWGLKLPTPFDKGYPTPFSDMSYWVAIVDGQAVAYTGSRQYDGFCIVGNTYVEKQYRKQGLHREILKERNANITGVKITCLNPIEESKLHHLISVVSSLGYTIIESFEDVEDIMDESFYNRLIPKFPNQQLWRKNHVEETP